MKLELALSHQVLLELSEADLRRFRLTVDCLQVPSAQTRAQLGSLLAALSQETGHVIQLSAQSRIDVLPDCAGGCLLIVSDCQHENSVGMPCAFFTGNVDALLDAARAVCKTGRNPRVTLLEIDDGYLLLADSLTKRTRTLLGEYLSPVFLSAASLTVLQERCRVLLEEAPLSTLRGGA